MSCDYHERRLKEAPFNAAVVLICGTLVILILIISRFIK